MQTVTYSYGWFFRAESHGQQCDAMFMMSSRTWPRCINFPSAPRNSGRLLYSLQDKEESTAASTEAGERTPLTLPSPTDLSVTRIANIFCIQ